MDDLESTVGVEAERRRIQKNRSMRCWFFWDGLACLPCEGNQSCEMQECQENLGWSTRQVHLCVLSAINLHFTNQQIPFPSSLFCPCPACTPSPAVDGSSHDMWARVKAQRLKYFSMFLGYAHHRSVSSFIDIDFFFFLKGYLSTDQPMNPRVPLSALYTHIQKQVKYNQ